ncbi:MAG: glycosyltransferase family 2 protein [Chloroflexi bacterium]|nr:glycosyltransferase family 2 protein [Chloroflexota bacterium]
MTEQPLVSIILPIRNEARYIGRCLEGVIAQDYAVKGAHDKIEVLVVDGMSTDDTREIVAEFMRLDPRIRLIDNPERIVPTALNRGLRLAHGEVIIRVDGHAVIARDYVRRCIETLAQVDADCVGGPIRTVGQTWMAEGIAVAQSSPFGVGSAAFRYADRAQYVDTLAFGAHRREIFARAGFFDEELVRNQDDEFNYRLIKAGGKIWLDPAIRSEYFSRASLAGLWKQYLEYGFWKVRVIQKHGKPASWRHLVPATFVLALVVSGALSLALRSPAWLLAVAAPYVLASLLASAWISSRRGWRYAPVLPLAFATMHLGYGLGFVMGTFHFGLLKPMANGWKRAYGREG